MNAFFNKNSSITLLRTFQYNNQWYQNSVEDPLHNKTGQGGGVGAQGWLDKRKFPLHPNLGLTNYPS
jgi:hypothetical protein